MRVVTETIGPERAKTLLEQNQGNRRLRKSAVAMFAAAMERGEWRITHQAIAIDKEGNLLDGQHRLAAVCKYGGPVQMLVAYDAPRDTFGVLDQGMKRSLGDHFNDDKFVVQPVSYLGYITFTSRSRTVLQYEQLRAVLQPYIDQFCGASGSDRAFVSNAPVKAAAIVTIMRHGNAARVIQIYNMVVNHDTDNIAMPAAGHAFLRQVATQGHRRLGQNMLFAKSLRLFDPAETNKTLNVHFPERDVEAVRVELLEALARGEIKAAA